MSTSAPDPTRSRTRFTPSPSRRALAALLIVSLTAVVACTRTVHKDARPPRDVSFNALNSLFNGPWAQGVTTTTLSAAGVDVSAGAPTTAAAPAGPAPTVPSSGPDPNNPILATIRQLESGNNYQAQAPGSSASGAYQMLDESWAGYGGYARAADAPPYLQDIKAAQLIISVLKPSEDITHVPVCWYIGHVPADDSSEWNIVPAPGAGNILTPRQYQDKWLVVYNEKWNASQGNSGN